MSIEKVAQLAMIKATLNKAGAKLTYVQVAELLGYDEPKPLVRIAQQLYELEKSISSSVPYNRSSWDCITSGTGGSAWHWGGQSLD